MVQANATCLLSLFAKERELKMTDVQKRKMAGGIHGSLPAEWKVMTPKEKAPYEAREAYGKSVCSRKNRARTLRRNEEGSISKHEKKAEKKKRCTEVKEEEVEFRKLMKELKVGAPAREELAEAMGLKEPAVCKLNCGHPCRN
ncbi:unnamed protein product [Caenorhabditis brenneri]